MREIQSAMFGIFMFSVTLNYIVGTLGEETFGTTVPQDENLPTRTTDVPHPGTSTLISAPRSNQLGHQEGDDYLHNVGLPCCKAEI